MSSSLLEAAFAHHVWATLRVIDACLARSAEELETSVLGTRGPMLDTLRHVVAGDTLDLYILTGDRAFDIDVGHVSLAEARVVMERNGPGWAELISRSLDPDAIVREVDATDGYERWAPVGFRLAAALDHGAIIAVRSAQPSRRSVWSRRRSMFTTSDQTRVGSWRSVRTRSACRDKAA
ncbi:MAG TPA: hypothetical protein VFI59_14885 [Actinomycetota bacterium]|nr:hypothetical protein [Actinomycetota bacterium]